MRLRFARAALAVAGLATMSCGSGLVNPSQNVTSTFAGTVAKGSSSSNPFTVSQNGEYFINLISLTPPLTIGLYAEILLVPYASGTCELASPVNGTYGAVAGMQVLTGTIVSGSYCVAIVDEGEFSANEIYDITVNHP